MSQRRRHAKWLPLALLLGGCAGAPLHVDPPALGAALVEPLPLHVAIAVDPTVRNYVFDDPIGIRYAAGSAGVAAFRTAFAATFATTTDATDPPGRGSFVELSATTWRREPPDAAPIDLSATFTVTLFDDGVQIAAWSTRQGVAMTEVEGDPGEPLRRRIGVYESEPTLLLEKATAAFLREFRDDPDVRKWLDAHSAYRPVLADERPPPPPLGTRGVAVTSDVASDAMRRCVLEGLEERVHDRPILFGPTVRRSLYPWLSDRPPVGVAVARWRMLAADAKVRSRLEELDLGTVVLVTGSTTMDAHGWGFCGGAMFNAGGCLGLIWGERKSLLAARILDLARVDEIDSASASRSGTAVVPMFMLPLPFIPATQSAACDEVSRAIAASLSHDAMPPRPNPGNADGAD